MAQQGLGNTQMIKTMPLSLITRTLNFNNCLRSISRQVINFLYIKRSDILDTKNNRDWIRWDKYNCKKEISCVNLIKIKNFCYIIKAVIYQMEELCVYLYKTSQSSELKKWVLHNIA